MDLNVAITGRRSVREYTAQAVDEKLIRALIDVAVQAPGAVNQQPWTFTIVSDQGVLDRISREAKSHLLAIVPANTQSDHLRPHLVDPDFHIFYHAPVLILISASAQGPGSSRIVRWRPKISCSPHTPLGSAAVGSVLRRVFSIRPMEKMRSAFLPPGRRLRQSSLDIPRLPRPPSLVTSLRSAGLAKNRLRAGRRQTCVMRLALAWTDYSLRTIKAQSKKVSDMQHLIVVAHPAEDSFTMGLTRSYAAECRSGVPAPIAVVSH